MSELSGNIYIEDCPSSFTKISNLLIENKNIDMFTLGLYCKIMRLGKKWKLNIKGLAALFSVSNTKIRSAMKSLENEGFLTRTAVHVDGRLNGWNYTFHFTPVHDDEKTKAGIANDEDEKYSVSKNRQHCKQTTLNSDNTENAEDNIINTEYIKRLNKEEEINIIDKPNKRPEWKDDYSAYVAIVDDAVSKLMADYEFQKKFEGWYTNIDYVRSVDKTADWWRSENGWDYAKRKRRGNLDMVMTLKRNMDRNRIYKPLDTDRVQQKINKVDEQLDLWRKMRDAED